MIVKTYEELFGKQLTVRDLIDGFSENTKTGEVVGFGGKLNIRPPYQREFVYELEKRKAVINTVLSGYPLNVMYWAKKDDETFELMDGQQRTLSICKFSKGEYSLEVDYDGIKKTRTFHSLGDKEKPFLDYPLTVYICDGTEDEKLSWFRIINIAGIKLTEQEMRNAIYNGTWLNDAKRYFSRIDGEGFKSEGHSSNGYTYGDYVDVVGGKDSEKENSVVRQKLLEIVLNWKIDEHNFRHALKKDEAISIDGYMEMHRNDSNARELWRYYEDVLEWVKSTFPTYMQIMKKVNWGYLYNRYKDENPLIIKNRYDQIIKFEDEIDSLKGIYETCLTGELKHLNSRNFDKKDIKRKFKEQNGICPYCKQLLKDDNMHGDHIVPWSKGGKTDYSNLQVLCSDCNLKKSAHDTVYKPWNDTPYESFDLKKWNEKDAK